MSKAAKLQRELEGLLAKKVALDAEVNHVWQQLRTFRIVAIRGGDGDSLGPLPQLGLDELQRSGQERLEGLERENYTLSSSPQYQRALANLNAENAA
jgi:hypothetical protein